MISFEGKNYYSPHDLMDFMECRFLACQKLAGLIDPDLEEDEFTRLLSAKGFEHEERFIDALRQSGETIVEIPKDIKLQEQIELTSRAMEEGPAAIYQPVLIGNGWHGHCDLLRRVDRPSRFGDFSYEVHDIKLSRIAKPSHILQISIYSRLLSLAQGTEPPLMHLVLGTGEKWSFRFSNYFHYCAVLCRIFEAFAVSPPSDYYPEPVGHCALCRLKEKCSQRLIDDDHLSLIADIGRSQSKKLNKIGISTTRQFAELPDSFHVPNMAPVTFRKLISQARLQVKGIDSREPCLEVLPQQAGRGFCRLPQPTQGDIFFDIEGDPLYADGLEYLFGFCLGWSDKHSYHCFWAHDHVEEECSLEGLMLFFHDHLSKNPDAFIYHYGGYEVTALKRLSSRYARCEAVLDDFLRKQRFVDLYRVVRETVRTSAPGYSLKDLEVFYMGRRSDLVKTAGDSVINYELWRQSGQGELLEQIRAYNETDCVSLIIMRDWLLGLRPPGIPWRVPGELKNETAWSEKEATRSEYETRLTAAVSGEELRVGQLTADLLEFHRREAKPQWWEMFDRQMRSDEELIDDIECIGALCQERAKPPCVDKRSLVHSYRFPEQDSKMKAGSACLCAATLEPAGSIEEIDFKLGTVSVRRSMTKGALPTVLSLIPTGPIKTDVLNNAIYRFADSVIENNPRYKAVHDFLRREIPHVGGRTSGMPIVPEGSVRLADISGAISSLDSSYLFIQGPPGSGKTYTACHAILELMQNGRRIGVMSNSHKAINNLLMKVEDGATERGLDFRGIKKSTAGQEDSFLRGTIIRDVVNNNEIDPTADLIAGTAWLFSRLELDQALDYLFIDEAGQVSIANVVAAGLSARNLVLIGDQMQLSQPIQGVHPRESGQSALDYLLQGSATVSPNRGIFLDRTWRMHENICSFISQAVYDGRLQAADENQNQVLLLDGRAHSALIPSGIRFLEVDHQGCSQKSEEEGSIIRDIYRSLLGQKYHDKKGCVHSIGNENILIVAPYNIQVNYLRSILPEGARVGTIDKFQGQEAEVSIISMTTSSEEELPRQLDFLYSRNRLNVAISRARILSLVLASPKLLEIKCRNPEEMELVNTLCWAREYANEIKAF